MTVCGICSGKVSRNQPVIFCDGFCNCEFHGSCCDVPADILKFLRKVPGLKWTCPNCTILAQKDNFVKIEEKFEVKLKQISDEMETTISEMKKDFIKMAENKLNEVTCSIKEVPSMSSNIKSFSAALKTKPSILIKPKNTLQKNFETRGEILHEINPIQNQLSISTVRNISKGGVIIGCDNDMELCKLKEMANGKLSEKYDISDVKKLSPRIRLVGMSEKLSEDVLLSYLTNQNKFIFNEISECKVIKIWPTKNNKNIYQAVLQVDSTTYNKLMSVSKDKLLVGLNYCSVYDSVYVLRCFKCNGFNHLSKDCSNQNNSCPRCAQEHLLEECKATDTELKCINCTNLNNINKSLKLEVSHAVWDSKCYVFNQKAKEYKSKIFSS
ncbi:unnamed protein product [Brassicogethes aeneus]|uniref:PHD-type domain-containing protein n=1 Tax=Brassicogethes aeneus TaxID=1431903 RepID=A0A9P0B0D5_BRAAE|nr:unnamed protein product [Brassicogethes aeneus]